MLQKNNAPISTNKIIISANHASFKLMLKYLQKKVIEESCKRNFFLKYSKLVENYLNLLLPVVFTLGKRQIFAHFSFYRQFK